jgi:hypothetical protein
MHHEGGSWTEVRTHTPSKLSKVQRTFVSHPLGLLQVSGERITASSELIVTVSVSALVGFQGPGFTEGIQPDFHHSLLPESLIFQWS